MLENFKQSLRHFGEAPPGKRFEQRFRELRQSRQSGWRKAVFIGVGVLIIAAGLLFLVTPGPGLLVVFVGAGLIAQQSLIAARALDWLDLWLRKLAKWGSGVWHRAPLVAKVVLVLFTMALAGLFAYAAYLLLFAK